MWYLSRQLHSRSVSPADFPVHRSEGFPARDIWFLGTLDQGSAQIPEFLGNRRRRRRRRRRLSDSQDGCPVAWFDWVTARMAVQFTGLIEWQPGWLSSLLVWLNDSQDGCPVYWFDWVTARMAVQLTDRSFSESENENISFQGILPKGPFQKVTSTK